MKKRPLVYVEFLDHAASNTWRRKELKNDMNVAAESVSAVGWLVEENDTFLLLASWDTQDQNNLRSYIIKAAILKRKVIRGFAR